MPYAIENIALIRNTDLAPEAPETIEELVENGQQLQEEGKTGEILCLQVGTRATRTTSIRCTPRPAATCSAGPTTAPGTPATWG